MNVCMAKFRDSISNVVLLEVQAKFFTSVWNLKSCLIVIESAIEIELIFRFWSP